MIGVAVRGAPFRSGKEDVVRPLLVGGCAMVCGLPTPRLRKLGIDRGGKINRAGATHGYCKAIAGTNIEYSKSSRRGGGSGAVSYDIQPLRRLSIGVSQNTIVVCLVFHLLRISRCRPPNLGCDSTTHGTMQPHRHIYNYPRCVSHGTAPVGRDCGWPGRPHRPGPDSHRNPRFLCFCDLSRVVFLRVASALTPLARTPTLPGAGVGGQGGPHHMLGHPSPRAAGATPGSPTLPWVLLEGRVRSNLKDDQEESAHAVRRILGGAVQRRRPVQR